MGGEGGRSREGEGRVCSEVGEGEGGKEGWGGVDGVAVGCSWASVGVC